MVEVWTAPFVATTGEIIASSDANAGYRGNLLYLRQFLSANPAAANYWSQSTGANGASWVDRAVAVLQAINASSGNAAFTGTVTASGNVISSGGGGIFPGGVTAASGNISAAGTVTAGGNVVSTSGGGVFPGGVIAASGGGTFAGALAAASAALTGALTAASAAITGAVTAASATLTGALSAASATISGTLTAATVAATTLTKASVTVLNQTEGDARYFRLDTNITSAGNLNITTQVNSPHMYRNGNELWGPDNDGSGSGLDADTLDGHDTSYFQTALGYTPARSVSGTYTGNGSSSGRQITTGFALKFVMIRNITTDTMFTSIDTSGGMRNDPATPVQFQAAFHVHASDGFVVGDGSTSANINTNSYAWSAFG